eukprot:TRINITY_DN1721_c0_g1_i1.p1 TRINITY_DN1721_c0_g1~~TRINITY_DN1721_c0_g1_i1.p1  ORF type:complete len:119 (-),score=8.87 TRINITY_DN1721_c0_g1_i1:103-459(-)
MAKKKGECTLHLLPCDIPCKGEAPVDTFFLIEKTSPGEFQSSFRGRALKGADLCLMEGYKGVVLQKSAKEYTIEKSFTKFTYWNHDSAPRRIDLPRQWMLWPRIAESIHTTIPLPTES